MIYIPSKKRSDLILKSLRHIAYLESVPVYVVVAPDEVGDYEKSIDTIRGELLSEVSVITRSDAGDGIAPARNVAIDHAVEQGSPVIVMIDDDMGCTKLDELLGSALDNPDAGGIGAYWPHYQRFLDLDPDQGIVPHTRTLGQACIAYNVENVVKVGKFDTRLHRKEDYDLRITLLKHGYPWYIHTDCKLKLVGKPYGAGGIQSLSMSQETVERQAYEILCKKHGPQFFSWSPSKTTFIRTHWVKINKAFGGTNVA